jgi:hypothetical protein
MNKYCKEYNLAYETLKHPENQTRAGDRMGAWSPSISRTPTIH